MQTYPLEEKCALVVTPDLAAAILLTDMCRDPECALPTDEIKSFVAEHGAVAAARNPAFREFLKKNGLFSVSDAYDILDETGTDMDSPGSMCHCSEFQGSAESPDGFPAKPGLEFEDDYLAAMTTERGPQLFKKAYESPDTLCEEYRDKLEEFVQGPFDPKEFIYDVTGTYFC